MKNAPNSKTNLDRAILRFAGDVARSNDLRSLMANSIVAQMIGDGVVKGGTGLKFRYGEQMSRVTLDLDTAWKTDLDSFLKGLKSRLADGWSGFSGEVRILRQASPGGIPFDYVMQPCDVKLIYLGRPWYTVQLEVGTTRSAMPTNVKWSTSRIRLRSYSRFSRFRNRLRFQPCVSSTRSPRSCTARVRHRASVRTT